jgi:hypothetical protein
MSNRRRASISPRQSFSSLILASISWAGESPSFPAFEPLSVVVAFLIVRDFSIIWAVNILLDCLLRSTCVGYSYSVGKILNVLSEGAGIAKSSVVTFDTKAPGGPRFAQRMMDSIAGTSPSTHASTEPSRRLRTQP